MPHWTHPVATGARFFYDLQKPSFFDGGLVVDEFVEAADYMIGVFAMEDGGVSWR